MTWVLYRIWIQFVAGLPDFFFGVAATLAVWAMALPRAMGSDKGSPLPGPEDGRK